MQTRKIKKGWKKMQEKSGRRERKGKVEGKRERGKVIREENRKEKNEGEKEGTKGKEEN